MDFFLYIKKKISRKWNLLYQSQTSLSLEMLKILPFLKHHHTPQAIWLPGERCYIMKTHSAI